MFFFPFAFFHIGSLINIAAALLPALYLLYLIYKLDRIEKEPPKLLLSLFGLGVLAALASILIETVLGLLLDRAGLEQGSILYAVLLAFVVVALAEEGTKYLFLRLRTWKHEAFNYRFDAVVYAVFISLGFAAFENVLYVTQNGLAVAIPRAILSVPGHMAFAVIMGAFYGRAKKADLMGFPDDARMNRRFALVFSIFLHGFYDACLMIGNVLSTVVFLIFVIVMYVFVIRLTRREASTDEPLTDYKVF